MEYEIHDNGGRPFRVVIDKSNVKIFNNETDELLHEYHLVKQIFIGTSPLNEMTEFSGGHGPDFDGNSILLNLLGNVYVYIGPEILMFMTNSPVVNYSSPVGNNDVPYPFAVCENKEVILLIENVCLTRCTNFEYPYLEYYRQSKMDMSVKIEIIAKDPNGYNDEEDNDWYVRYSSFEEKDQNFYINDKKYRKYYLNNQPITLEDIHRRIKIYGEEHGFKQFKHTILTKRLW